LEAQLILNQKFKNMEVPRENGAAILWMNSPTLHEVVVPPSRGSRVWDLNSQNRFVRGL
jgi:hypothetical protein